MTLATDRVLLVHPMRLESIGSRLDITVNYVAQKRALSSGRSTPASCLVVDHDQEGRDHGSLVLYCTARN